MSCDVLLKQPSVDGVYSAGPTAKIKMHALRHLTHHYVLSQDLKVMDAAAFR